MKRTCLLGKRWPGCNLEDGRWPGVSSIKVKGRDIWTALNAGAGRAVSGATADVDREGLILCFEVARYSGFLDDSSLA